MILYRSTMWLVGLIIQVNNVAGWRSTMWLVVLIVQVNNVAALESLHSLYNYSISLRV